MNPALYQYRPPIDLTNARLRKLATGLGAGIRARQRHVGEHYLLPRFRSGAEVATSRLQRRAYSSAVEGPR